MGKNGGKNGVLISYLYWRMSNQKTTVCNSSLPRDVLTKKKNLRRRFRDSTIIIIIIIVITLKITFNVNYDILCWSRIITTLLFKKCKFLVLDNNLI